MIVVGILASVLGYFMRKKVAEGKIKSAEDQAQRILQDAGRDAESKRKNPYLKQKKKFINKELNMKKKLKNAEMSFREWKEDFF